MTRHIDPVHRFLGVSSSSHPIEMLGVLPSSMGPQQIQDGVTRRIAQIHRHPDGDSLEAEEAIECIEHAGAVLSDPAQQGALLASWRAMHQEVDRRHVAQRMTPTVPSAAPTPLEEEVMGVVATSGGWNQACLTRLGSIAIREGLDARAMVDLVHRAGRKRLPPPVVGRSVENAGDSSGEIDVELVWANIEAMLHREAMRIRRHRQTIVGSIAGVLLVVVAFFLAAVLSSPDVTDDSAMQQVATLPEHVDPPAGNAAATGPTLSIVSPLRGTRSWAAVTDATDGVHRHADVMRAVAETIRTSGGAVSEKTLTEWSNVLGQVLLAVPHTEGIDRTVLLDGLSEVLQSASTWPAVIDAIMSPIPVAVPVLLPPLEMWISGSAVGVLGKIAGDHRLAPLPRSRVRALLHTVLPPSTERLDSYDAALQAWLIGVTDAAVTPTGIAMLLHNRGSADRWETILRLAESMGSSRSRSRVILNAMEGLLIADVDLARGAPPQALLRRLLQGLGYTDDVAVKEGVTALLGDERILTRDVWVLTSLLAADDATPWFVDHLIIDPGADLPHRRRIRDRIWAYWPAIDRSVASGQMSIPAGFTKGLAVTWLGLSRRVLGEPPGHQERAIAAHLVALRWCNEAAANLIMGDGRHVLSRLALIETYLKDGPSSIITGNDHITGIIDRPRQDGSWGRRYSSPGKSVDQRLDLLEDLLMGSWTDLGPIDAATLVHEAMAASGTSVREYAQHIITTHFSHGPTVALAVLDHLDVARRTRDVSTFLQDFTGTNLPTTASGQWRWAARENLLRHALGTRIDEGGPLDKAAELLERSAVGERSSLTGVEGWSDGGGFSGGVSGVGVEMESLAEAWLEEARRLQDLGLVHQSDHLDESLLRARQRVAMGVLQRHVAHQWTVADGLSLVSGAMVQNATRGVLVPQEIGVSRDAQTILQQLIAGEAASTRQWRWWIQRLLEAAEQAGGDR